MAENNFAQQMAQWQALQPQTDPGKSMPIFMGAKGEVNVVGGLSLKGVASNMDGNILKAPQVAPGPLAKLLEGMGLTRKQILEGLKEVNQKAPIQNASIADITGSSHGLGGGSFASSISSGGPSGGYEV